MANIEENEYELYDYLEVARFTEQRLAGATIATLISLRNDSCVGCVISEKAKALWKSLVNEEPLNTAEREVIDRAIASLRSGVSTLGQSYEEMAYAKGTKVVYTEASIVLAPKNEKPVVIPNHPVPPVPKVETRINQEWIDSWAMNFDISGGEVVLNRQIKDMESLWQGQYSRINLSGLDALRGIVRKILQTSPQWEELRREKRSCQGLAYMDMWTSACATCPFQLYLVLHDVIIKRCLSYMRVRPNPKNPRENQIYAERAPVPNSEKLVVAYPSGSIISVEQDMVEGAEVDAVRAFYRNAKHYPKMIAGPIPSAINFYVAEGANDIHAVLAYARMQKMLGAKKRGLGRIAASWNHGPRMSKVWREINTLIALLQSARTELADIRVSSGAFGVLLSYLKSRDTPNIKLLINDSQVHLLDSLTESDRGHVVTERREGTVLILVGDKPKVPELDPKKARASEELMATAYTAWKRNLPKGDFIMATKVFRAKAIEEYTVFTFKSNFDLSAIVCSKEAMLKTNEHFEPAGKDFFEEAIRSMRKMMTWWHAPEKTFSTLSTVYIPEAGTLQWSLERGFEMNATFEYNVEDQHGEDEVEDAEWEEEEEDEYDEEEEEEEEEVLQHTLQLVVQGKHKPPQAPPVTIPSEPAIPTPVTKTPTIAPKKGTAIRTARGENSSAAEPKRGPKMKPKPAQTTEESDQENEIDEIPEAKGWG